VNQQLVDLLARIRALQEEVEDTYRLAREEFDRQRALFAEELQRRQRGYKVGLLRFIAGARPLVIVTAPVIYAGCVPFVLMDLFVTVYQALCFPVYGISKVPRAGYLAFDRGDLPYLNLIERLNCSYCAYANGVTAYTREVAARSEQYWCPIKHARRLGGAHDYYPNFLDYGDAQAYRQELERLRKDLAELRSSLPKK
jgi:hypothetical protein